MKQNLLKLTVIYLLCLLQVGLMAQTTKSGYSPTLSDETISIYPNPMQGKSTVSFVAKLDGFTLINAYSVDGKMIISTGEYLKAGNNSFSLSLPKGVFILKIKGIEFSNSAKIISQSPSEIKPEITYIGTENISTASSKSMGLMRVNESTAPTIDSFTIVSLGHVYAVGRVNVSSAGPAGATITARGICWCRASVSRHPTPANGSSSSGTGIGTSYTSAGGLSPLTTYYISAYATNNLGYTALTDPICVKTTDGASYGLPALSTIDVTSISSSSAISGGNITAQGTTAVTARGLCWSINPNPTIDDNKTSCGPGIGTFNATVYNLLPSTTYYVRAFATNGPGTNYGNEIEFRTRAVQVGESFDGGIVAYIYNSTDAGYISNARGGILVSPANLTSAAWYNGTYTLVGANQTSLDNRAGYANTTTIVYSQGSGAYAASLCMNYAVGWHLPTKDELNKIYINKNSIAGLSNGNYWSSSENTSYYAWCQDFSTGVQTSLPKNNIYFVRASRCFYTSSSFPVVSTTSITSRSSEAAVGGGNVESNEGSEILARGVCWNTTGAPTTTDNKTTDGTGTGLFTSSMTGLVYGQTYYIRAYATNMTGTGYGAQRSFTYTYPLFITPATSTITQTSAIISNNIASDGGQNISARGICWNQTGNPSVSDNIIKDGNAGTGTFTSSMANLTGNT